MQENTLSSFLLRACGLAAGLLGAAASAQAQDVTLQICGIEQARGSLQIAAYQFAEQWLKQAAWDKSWAIPADAKGCVSLPLSGLPDGPLAFAVYQDLNQNGRLDTNAVGAPQEPFGFSHHAIGNFGPPRFDQAVLAAPAGSVQRIELN